VRGLDTNVLLRVLVADDPEQLRRVRAFLAARPPASRCSSIESWSAS